MLEVGKENPVNSKVCEVASVAILMSEEKTKRRDFLFTATYAVGAVGAAATIWPMIDQMNPDASVKALASTEVDVSTVNPGKTITVLWRGKPVFIRRRTQKEISEARSVKLNELKDPQKDEKWVRKWSKNGTNILKKGAQSSVGML